MVEFVPAGDSGLILKFGERIAPEINQRVRAMFLRIESEKVPGIIELIPAYSELLICFDPLETDHKKLIDPLLPFFLIKSYSLLVELKLFAADRNKT